jgi:anti-sigma B factor antagonist
VAPTRQAVGTSEPLTDAAFTCRRIDTAAGSVLTLTGELDLVTADRARDALGAAQRDSRTVVCDLGDVFFVDLSGLRVLLDAAAHATRSGGRLIVTRCPPIVPRMLRLLKLEAGLEIRPAPRPRDASRSRCDRPRGHVSSR